jgi:hypothetical protein
MPIFETETPKALLDLSEKFPAGCRSPVSSFQLRRMKQAVLLLGLFGCANQSQQCAPCAAASHATVQSSPAPAGESKVAEASMLDEATLMEKIRQSATPDPATALALAEEGERRFADSASTEERSALAIRALINLQRIGAARGRAAIFLQRYPNGPYSSEVAAKTGMHPVPNAPQK